MKYQVQVLNREDRDFGWRMVIRRNGVTVQEEYDNGEPEDNLFCRDWSWVEDALNKAYEYGLEDGASD